MKLKRLVALLCGVLLAAFLTACGSRGEAGNSPAVSEKAKVSWEESSPDSRAASKAETLSSQPESEASQAGEALTFVQKESGAEAGYEPTVRLFPDGTFTFSVYLYDGTATLTGVYTDKGDDYLLTVTESTAQGFAAGTAGEICFTKAGESVFYSGEQLGVTADGAEFAAA